MPQDQKIGEGKELSDPQNSMARAMESRLILTRSASHGSIP